MIISFPEPQRIELVQGAELSLSFPAPQGITLQVEGIQGPPGSGGGVSDGDKGGIVVSGSGAVWTVKAGSITDLMLGTSAIALFAAASHTHIIANVTGLQAALDGKAALVHTHLLAAGATDLTITAANLNSLDDGADSALHFHASDRARANHTGSQLAATISDFDSAVLSVPVPYILRTRPVADWDGTSLVGDGITFTQGTPANRPTPVGDALRFDGINDVLTATVSIDMKGKTLVWVAQPTGGASTQSGILNMKGAASLAATIEAQAIGDFNSRARFASFGTGTTLLQPSTVLNVIPDQAGVKYCGILMFTQDEVFSTSGATAAVRTTLSEGGKVVTSFELGRNAGGTNYCAVDIFEFALIDSTDLDVINQALLAISESHGISVPIFSPYLETNARSFGDSISVGAQGVVSNGSLEDACNALICLIGASGESGLAGAQMSPYGLVSPADDARIAACFSRAPNSAGAYTGKSLILVHFGANDFKRDVPIGSPSDVTEDTFCGALRIGHDYIKSFAPALPIVITCPFYAQDEDVPNLAGHVMEDYRVAIRAFCETRGIPVADMSLAGIDAVNFATYLADGLHPNDAGYALGTAILLPVIRAGMPKSVGNLQIAIRSVTLDKLDDIDTDSFLGRDTAGRGAPEPLPPARATALLELATTSLKGLAPARSGVATEYLNGAGAYTVPPGGSGTDLSYDAASRVLSSSTGADSTLPLMSSGDAGLVPASGGGTTTFLRADGTFAAPPGGGGGGPSPATSWVI